MFDLVPFGQKDRNLFDYFNKVEKYFFDDMQLDSNFRTDIIDEDNKYILQAELPGFTREDIHIDIEGDYMTISAEHREDFEETKDNYIRKERRYGAFTRRFDVSNIKTDQIHAQYKNGLLELEMPKIHKEKSSVRKIDIQ